MLVAVGLVVLVGVGELVGVGVRVSVAVGVTEGVGVGEGVHVGPKIDVAVGGSVVGTSYAGRKACKVASAQAVAWLGGYGLKPTSGITNMAA